MIPLLFIDLKFIDIIDVLLVGFIIYQLYQLTKGTAAIKIFLGLFLIYILWKIVDALQMNMLGEILGQLMGVGVIAIIIVFQQELRQFLLFVGDREFFKTRSRFLQRWLPKQKKTPLPIEPIVHACEKMAKTRTGALLVFQKNSPLDSYIRSQRRIEGLLSSSLLQSIFLKDGPLHDGAVLIAKNKIQSAGGVLPVSKQENLPVKYGLRHRAALGLTEETDALVIVVSEETGNISLAMNGEIKSPLTPTQLTQLLSNAEL